LSLGEQIVSTNSIKSPLFFSWEHSFAPTSWLIGGVASSEFLALYTHGRWSRGTAGGPEIRPKPRARQRVAIAAIG
jgi:hypothetical protein